ncbi:MAG: dihydropteroate synthase [Pseudomonadota bacterium]
MKELTLGSCQLSLRKPLLMGVLNVTPDSFSDGGKHDDLDSALEAVAVMQAAGVDIVDVGGESTRPGAEPVSVDAELARVVPVVEAIVASSDMPVSIDTSKPDVMRAAVAAGATLINDVWALRQPGALEAAASLDVAVCLMHMQGEPGSMQEAPFYDDPVGEVAAFLQARAERCIAAGISANRILLDPGFGFGKRLQDNVALLRELPRLVELGFPLLVGLSRKSMIGEMTGKPVDQRLLGSVILALAAARRGASVLRVHDVAETREALDIVEYLADEVPAAIQRE